MSTLELTAHDAGYAMLIDETEYKQLVTSTGEPFAYFLNPAVYGSGASFVHYDEDTDSFVLDDNADLHYLDDRYGVGANYLSDLYGRPPYGSNLPGVFIPLDGTNTLVDVRDDVANLKLTKAYTSAVIVPFLVVKVYEQRLASYEYYTYLGKPLGGGTNGTVNSQTYLPMTKETLIETLGLALETELTAGGDLHDAYLEFTGLNIAVDYNATSRTLAISNMARVDGVEVEGERFGEITTGHMMRPDIVLPGLTKVVGHEYYGFKPMRGVYTVFAPEKLHDLVKVVENTVGALTNVTDAQKAALVDQLGYHWYDFFRGSDQAITIKVPDHLAPRTTLAADAAIGSTTLTVESTDGFADSGTFEIGSETITYSAKTATTFTVTATTAAHTSGDTVIQRYDTIRANVFLSAYGSQLVGATVSVQNEDGTVTEVANSHGINLTDSFSHVDEKFHTSQPTAQRYTTGPYGARGIVNEDGSVTWLSDAYSV